MSPYLGIALFVAVYEAAHLYSCTHCRRRARAVTDNLRDRARSFRRSW